MAPTLTNIAQELRQTILLEAVLASEGSHKNQALRLNMADTPGPTELERTISALSKLNAQTRREMVWVLKQAQDTKTKQYYAVGVCSIQATRGYAQVDDIEIDLRVIKGL